MMLLTLLLERSGYRGKSKIYEKTYGRIYVVEKYCLDISCAIHYNLCHA